MKRTLVVLSLLLIITACTNQADEINSTALQSPNTAVQKEVVPTALAPVVVIDIKPKTVPAAQPTPTIAAVVSNEEPAVEAYAVTGTQPIVQSIEPTAVLPPCPICDFDYSSYTGPLTTAEVDGLLRALNDEYHAWAIYGQVVTDFGQVRPFTNIQRAEQNHINALTPLFTSYGLPLPENPWIGTVPSFETVGAACQAGYDAEIVNAELYDVLFASTEQPDIEQVYTALQRASNENHLPAFERCLNRTS